MELQIAVGKVLRAFRKQKKFSLEKMESKINVSSSYLSKVERGVSNASLDVIERYYSALDLNTDTFLSALNISVQHKLDEDELKMMNDYSKLNRKEKESIHFIINRMILAKGNQFSADRNE
ncbi:helix-turn-helix domain-containing protein [Paenibacillus bovis]|uniref:HTH cro/C1-type domain-containing protein n=1 Tax=Paenibacillus bovis TaxID=1616788 RepID=A0A1X9T419_9BACL|nr:helix-turn-helix transcriptional regulator [Paenibacillus bovis]ARR10707.1 hypothetical protein AR543_p0099 [Paenibacillus bovis]